MVTPGIIPISDNRKYQARVLEEIDKRPVVLTQHGRGVAVLVSIEQWENLNERLEDLEDSMTALEARLSQVDEPGVPLDEVLAELNIRRKRTDAAG